jgi:capsular exopolysaccharide synthesis family protein
MQNRKDQDNLMKDKPAKKSFLKKAPPHRDILLDKDAPFAVVEAYKNIRTNMMFALSSCENKRVVISSAMLSEGKSITSINVGIAFSQLGHKVLLIDGDMRKPTVYKKLKLNNSKGLSSILVGFCKLREAVKNVYPNFDVLTSGPIPPNPSELLGSDNMSTLLDGLKDYYDYIIIDTPPINIVVDALVLTPKTDGLVLVVQEGKTTHDQFKKALGSIEFAGVKLLGSIVNGDRPEGGKYGYSYKYK